MFEERAEAEMRLNSEKRARELARAMRREDDNDDDNGTETPPGADDTQPGTDTTAVTDAEPA
ncbi:hypothetical protein ABZ464_50570 [Streptomyces sp. NPDC005820]|uniref:hypothetical protein n=1 Tax=Streptomyces sp. NPDC005820 TaxID=3157069 RepID=UPI0033D6A2E3